MAERRMFAKTIIDSDAFLDMPLSSQALYFHLSMRADDEGFVNNPKKIQRMIGASDDDMKVLLAKNFIILFESGVIVIKHWKIHNYIRGDRIAETKYQDEKALLEIKDNGAYTLSQEIKEIEILDAKDIRKIAYAESSLPYSFTYKIKRAFEGKECPVCGKHMTSAYKTAMPTIQHNIPISKGGKHELDNISIICESCNTSIRNNETGALNNADVIEMWDKIIWADKHTIRWFSNPALLDEIDPCQTNDGQMSGTCQANVSIGKDSIDKDSIDKNNIYIVGEPTTEKPKKDSYMDQVEEILSYLNEKTGKKFTSRSKSSVKMIKDRLREGYVVDEFKAVIDNKTAAWGNNPDMRIYLRPETLFRPSHFDSYLNDIEDEKQKRKREAAEIDERQREAIRQSNDFGFE